MSPPVSPVVVTICLGGFGDDQLYGGGGPDVMYGGQDSDFLEGMDGNDKSYGGSGVDIMVLDIDSRYSSLAIRLTVTLAIRVSRILPTTGLSISSWSKAIAALSTANATKRSHSDRRGPRCPRQSDQVPKRARRVAFQQRPDTWFRKDL